MSTDLGLCGIGSFHNGKRDAIARTCISASYSTLAPRVVITTVVAESPRAITVALTPDDAERLAYFLLNVVAECRSWHGRPT